jgi:type I restriction enzyme S subunit
MKSNYRRLGDYIREVNNRNTELRVTNLLGINIDKFFMPSVANVVGTDMTSYKIVNTGQFACNRMHVGRDQRLPVALSRDPSDFLVSPAYNVFEVIDPNVLLPEYLMMWFSRREFDRNVWFYTDADVRGGLNWKDFCNMELPVPDIAKQREIVKEYNVLVNRIALNNQLNQKLEETAQAIYKQWFIDFEFPDEDGKPYKSNGGEMVESEFGEIPLSWKVGRLGDLIDVVNGYAFDSNDFYSDGDYPILKIANIVPPHIRIENSQYYTGKITNSLKNYIVESGNILISMTGSWIEQINSAVGKVGRYNYKNNALLNQRVGKLNPKNNIPCNEYVYYFIAKKETQLELLTGATGSANQANISSSQIKALRIILPGLSLLIEFEKFGDLINQKIILSEHMNKHLESLKDLILIKNTQI